MCPSLCLLFSSVAFSAGSVAGSPAQPARVPSLVIGVADTAGARVPNAEVRAVPLEIGRAALTRTTAATPEPLPTVDFRLAIGGGGPSVVVTGQNGPPAPQEFISPSRPVPTGQAPGMQVKLVSKRGSEKVYAVIFRKDDEVLSGLTDFAIQNHIGDAHFTAIGAVSHALVGWLDLGAKQYRAIHVEEQVEVLSMMGDIATFRGKPVVHAHMVFGRHDGTTVGGHLWEAYVNPTLEVFVTVNAAPLQKKADDASGMKLIDPALD